MKKNKLKFVIIIISTLIIILVGTFIIFKFLKHKTQNTLKTENEEQNIVTDINTDEVLENTQNNENNTDNVDNKQKELTNNFEESKESKVNTAQSNTNTNTNTDINIPKNQTNSQNTKNNKEENNDNQKNTSTEEKKQENTNTQVKEDVYTFKRNDTEIQKMISIAKRIIKENKNGQCDGLYNQINSINFIIGKAGNIFYPLFDYRIENIVANNFYPEFYVYAEDIYLNGNFVRTEYYFN